MMANFTAKDELAWLGSKLQNNTATPGDKQRFETLLKREITWRLMADMPAIQAEARRRVAPQLAAREAARRAGQAAAQSVYAQWRAGRRKW